MVDVVNHFCKIRKRKELLKSTRVLAIGCFDAKKIEFITTALAIFHLVEVFSCISLVITFCKISGVHRYIVLPKKNFILLGYKFN